MFKDVSIFSSGGHLVQWSGTVLAILVKEHHHHWILINMQVQGQHPHQWAPVQVDGLLQA